MSEDLISRQKAVDAIFELSDKVANEMLFIDAIVDEIENIPSAEPERKKGGWIKEYWNSEHTRKCSACNITQTVTIYKGKVNFNFCPYCGADMRGEE